MAGRATLFKHLEADAGLLDHADDLLRREHKVHIRHAIAAELGAARFHLFRRAGHDSDMIGRVPIGGIFLAITVLEHRRQHLHGRECGGKILEELWPLVFHVAHPCGAAGGHQRQVFACFEPAQELLRLFTHREVCAENGVVHLIRAHDLECRDELVEHVFAARDAVGLTERYAHSRCDLDDDTLLRVVQRAPGLTDLVFTVMAPVVHTAEHWPQLTQCVFASNWSSPASM